MWVVRSVSPSTIRTDDVDRALEDHEEVVRRVTGAVQDVAHLDGTLFTERRQLGQRRGIQRGRGRVG